METTSYLIPVIGITLFAFVGLVVYRWVKGAERYEAETVRCLAEMHPDEAIQSILKRGYIFCFFWNVTDIHELGKGLGVYLTDQDCIKVACMVKERFNPETGLSNGLIQDAIMDYCKTNVVQRN